MDSDEKSSPTRRGDDLPLTPGKVYLVGAGPGDPSLLTLRAAELLRAADLVVLDALVSSEIVTQIGSHARIIDAGKRSNRHAMTQEEINALLVEEGGKRKVVVRLKGGDPFVFGRGGEEAEALQRAGVPFEVVPGITSAIAAPAYAGIPVTHRQHASSVTFITAHESDGSTGIPWEGLARLNGTLVFLMGLGNLESIAERLVEHGMSSETAAAVISRGTTRLQRTVRGTLGTIVELARKAELEAPALIVVGGVVSLQQTIGWFESRPLFGRSFVVTRARAQASGLVRLLEGHGASVVQFPMIEISKPESWDSLDAAIERLTGYDWIVFSSANGVDAFFERLQHHGRDLRALTGTKIAAVGDATAASLHVRGIIPDLVPETFQSAALLPHFPAELAGMRIAVVRAASGREELITELRRRGAEVDLAVAYQTRPARGLRDQLGSMLGSGKIDAITFTSSSTVENFFEQLSEEERRNVIENVQLASIGPVTSQTLRSHGAEPSIEAPEATIPSLAEAIVEHFGR
ncbi:MAG TPA: uroporphyrinogen-III C-methyltransferase [Thermoanaerobaculia bacterium]|nr:uroporphyrinogen-III C-methyltransferase [Thermoanaerobaculia bacterium]